MVDVRGVVLRPPHCTTPAAVKANKNKNEFKSNENIRKKEDGSFYVVSAIKPHQWPCNDPTTKACDTKQLTYQALNEPVKRNKLKHDRVERLQ